MGIKTYCTRPRHYRADSRQKNEYICSVVTKLEEMDHDHGVRKKNRQCGHSNGVEMDQHYNHLEVVDNGVASHELKSTSTQVIPQDSPRNWRQKIF